MYWGKYWFATTNFENHHPFPMQLQSLVVARWAKRMSLPNCSVLNSWISCQTTTDISNNQGYEIQWLWIQLHLPILWPHLYFGTFRDRIISPNYSWICDYHVCRRLGLRVLMRSVSKMYFGILENYEESIAFPTIIPVVPFSATSPITLFSKTV